MTQGGLSPPSSPPTTHMPLDHVELGRTDPARKIEGGGRALHDRSSWRLPPRKFFIFYIYLSVHLSQLTFWSEYANTYL